MQNFPENLKLKISDPISPHPQCAHVHVIYFFIENILIIYLSLPALI